MLENRMIIGTPGDYYNSPFDRTPVDTWTCPTCHSKWNLYDQYDAERPAFPWEHEDSRGYTKLSKDPRMNGCCGRCAFDSAKTKTLIDFIENSGLIGRVVESFATDDEYQKAMWEAIKQADVYGHLRNDLADLVGDEYETDFIEWRAEQ